MRDATDKQLDYLDDLGYDGEDPETIEIASMAIDMMKSGATPAMTSKAVSKANRSILLPQKPRRSCGCCLAWILIAIVLGVIIVSVMLALSRQAAT
jgi:hypothetical protein